jgi:hypothetical protein
MTNGSLGEMATLSYEEWKAFNQAVVQTAKAANPDLLVFIRVTTLSTRGTIGRAATQPSSIPLFHWPSNETTDCSVPRLIQF